MTSSNWVAKAIGLKAGAEAGASGSQEDDVVVLVQGKNVFGDKIYCYLKLPHPSLDEFKGKLASRTKFDIRDYGSIVAAGRGEPTLETESEMKNLFGMLPIAEDYVDE